MVSKRLSAFQEAFRRATERAMKSQPPDDLAALPRFSTERMTDRLDPAQAEEWLAFDAVWEARRDRIDSDRDLYEVSPDLDDPEVER